MFVRVAVASVLLAGSASAAVVDVTTAADLKAALAAAKAGDEIVLADGVYAFTASLEARADGTESQRIVVRAQNRHGARVRFDALEGFKVSGRNWTFDGLDVQGTCADDSDCEHAFHVFGDAQNFVLRNSRVYDFNAQLKVNASKNAGGTWEIPHRGLIERNELFDTSPRNTSNPVTKLNIDTGDGWVVRDNLLYDFHKQGGNNISYGAFMKSGGKDGVFERNLVFCTRYLKTGGTRMGLSFGGGGTGAAFCAPAFDASVPCDPEHTGGVMRNNVVVNCSDVAIYLNRAANTRVLFNTLIQTSGVDYRYASSSGEAHGNVLTGVVRTRDGASVTSGTNMANVSAATFASWYTAPLEGDLDVKGDVSALLGATSTRSDVPDDFCARPRPSAGSYTLGAIEHALGDCAQWPGEAPSPPVPDAGVPGVDAGADAQDAGLVAMDAGIADAGSSPSIPDESAGEVGCGCSSSSGESFAAPLLLAAVLLRRRASGRSIRS